MKFLLFVPGLLWLVSAIIRITYRLCNAFRDGIPDSFGLFASGLLDGYRSILLLRDTQFRLEDSYTTGFVVAVISVGIYAAVGVASLIGLLV